MKRIKRFFINALILGATTIFLRGVSVAFGAYLSDRIGAEGMGLFSLISGVYLFGVTLASSGIHLAVTKLVSEEIERKSGAGVEQTVKAAVKYALFFGGLSFLLLFFGARFIADRILHDSRTYLSLRVFSVALPFIALSNVFAGYFNAKKRAYKNAVTSIAEQLVRIIISSILIGLLSPRGMEYACLALVIGTAASEALSLLYLLIFYIIDKKKCIHTAAGEKSRLTGRLLGIALPIALSSYLRSGLVTVSHILIPVGLRRHGANAESALASYGTVHGMALPLVLFPSAVCTTFAGLIVPELAELAVRYGSQKSRHIRYIVRRSLSVTLLFAIGTAGILALFSDSLGLMIYNSTEAGKYIRIFAPLVPVMYLDTAVDGMLKGLGEQMRSMFYNIIDASMSVLLVWTLTPRLGIYGYIICVFVTELVNLSMSLGRLLTVTGVFVPLWRGVALPTVCIIGAAALSFLCLNLVPFPTGLTASTVLGILFCLFCYAVLLRTTGTLRQEDIRWLRSLGRNG